MFKKYYVQITNNLKDFRLSKIEAKNPVEFVKLFF